MQTLVCIIKRKRKLLFNMILALIVNKTKIQKIFYL